MTENLLLAFLVGFSNGFLIGIVIAMRGGKK